MPWRSAVWAQLATAHPEQFGDLLTADEIRAWQHRVLHWFGELKQEPQIVPHYLTERIVLQFVRETVDAVCSQMQSWKEAFQGDHVINEEVVVR